METILKRVIRRYGQLYMQIKETGATTACDRNRTGTFEAMGKVLRGGKRLAWSESPLSASGGFQEGATIFAKSGTVVS